MRTKPAISTNLVGVDSVISSIASQIEAITYNYNSGTLPWFDPETIYGLAERSKNGLPYIIWRSKEFHELIPNDNYRSIVFFYEHDARQFTDGLFTYDISLVVWFDQHKIQDKIGYRIKEYPIEKIRKILYNDDRISDVQIYTDKQNIFSDWDIKDAYEKYVFNDRFDGFRFRFKLTGQADCAVDLQVGNPLQLLIPAPGFDFSTPNDGMVLAGGSLIVEISSGAVNDVYIGLMWYNGVSFEYGMVTDDFTEVKNKSHVAMGSGSQDSGSYPGVDLVFFVLEENIGGYVSIRDTAIGIGSFNWLPGASQSPIFITNQGLQAFISGPLTDLNIL